MAGGDAKTTKKLIDTRRYLKGRITHLENQLGDLNKIDSHVELTMGCDRLRDLFERLESVNLELELRESTEAAEGLAVEDKCTALMKKIKCRLEVLSQKPSFGGREHASESMPNLPKVNLPTFTGDYGSWMAFKDLFTSMVHANDHLTAVQKFYYLKSCLGGEAASLVSTLECTNDNYTKAWTTLTARNRIERTASKRWRGSLRRVIAATIYNLSCFTHGCSTGWVSGVLGNEALTGGAWLAALPCLVALPAAPFFAVLADARGRKAGALCVCISFIISWSLAAWCGPRGVWAARVAAGAGGAGALALAPLYCAEIAPRTRGLAAMPALACSSGILFAYAAGGIFSAHALSLSMAVPPCILLVALLWLPETPSFLISIGKIQDAARVMCWFDGSDFQEDLTDVIEQQEVRIRTSDYSGRRDMRRQDSDTFQPMLKRVSGLESNSEKRTEQSACRELFHHRSSLRALFTCFVLLCAAAGSGAGAVNSFAAAVLRHSSHDVPHLNLTVYNFTFYNGTVPRALFDTSEAGSMLCGSALVLGAAVATFTVDKLGRKMLLLWSCSGIACCLAILGIYCDPRIRIASWYSQRLWPYKRITLKDKPINENLSLTYQGSIAENAWTNLTEQVLKLDFNDEKNITDGIGKPWYRIGEPGPHLNESTSSEVVMSKYETDDDEEAKIWAPVILLSMVLFLYNIGLGSVPYVLISELFTINVRSLASSFFISWMWLSNFLLLRYYGTIAVKIGLHSTYYISASVTLLGAVYTYFWIPETKGKTDGQIHEALEQPFLGRKVRKSEDSR